MKRTPQSACPTAALLAALSLAWAAAPAAGSANETEPVVTRAESDTIASASAVAATNVQAAIGWLEGRVHRSSSAALDFTLGNLRMLNGDAAGAGAAYEAATAKMPLFCAAWQNLGQARLAEGNSARAAAALLEAVRVDPSRWKAFSLLGHAWLAADRPVSAEAAFRQALMGGPDDAPSLAGLLRCLSLQDRHREAAALAGELTRIMPDRPEIWSLRARALIALDEPDAALRVLETAKLVGAADVSMLLAAADLWLNAGVAGMAVARYDEAFRAGNVAPGRALRAVRALLQTGNGHEAARLLDGIDPAALTPEEERHRLLSKLDILALQGRSEEAAASCRERLGKDPLDADCLMRLGNIHREKKEWEDALICFERASRVKGMEADGLVKQAEVEVLRRRYARAVELLEAAQAVDERPHVGRYLEQVRRLLGD
jgi:tetratricopeptide (TPR) repeat protein